MRERLKKEIIASCIFAAGAGVVEVQASTMERRVGNEHTHTHTHTEKINRERVESRNEKVRKRRE